MPGIITDEVLPPYVEVLSLTQRIGQEMGQMVGTAGSLAQTIGGSLVDAMGEFGQAAILSGQGFAGAMMGAIGTIARGLGQMFQSKAIGALGDAFLNPLTAAKSLAAYGKYQLAAGMAFALAGTGGRGGGGGYGGGFGGGGTAGFEAARTGDMAEDARGEGTLILEGDPYLDMSDPKKQDALARAIETLGGLRLKIEHRF